MSMNRERGSKRDARLAFSCLWLVSWYKCQYLIGWNNWLTDVGPANLPRGDNEEKFNPWNVLSKWADSINKCRHDYRLTLREGFQKKIKKVIMITSRRGGSARVNDYFLIFIFFCSLCPNKISDSLMSSS